MPLPPDVPPDKKGTILWLFERYEKDLLRFLSSITRSRQELEDHFQEVFLRVAALKDLSHIEELKDYLFAIAANVVTDARRKNARNAVVVDSAQAQNAAARPERHDVNFTPHTTFDQIDQQIDLAALSEGLPPGHLELIVLKHRGEAIEEIAVLKSMSTHAVKRQLQEAYAHMRSRLKWSQRKGKP